MKLIDHFEKFLKDTVNLNKTRFDIAIQGFDTITSFLRNHENLGDLFVKTSPQGSFRQKTIIKPATDDDEFDVDLLLELKPVAEWEPKQYLAYLTKQFRDSERYKDIILTSGKTRCVTINYANDFHVDVVPTIIIQGQQFVMNKSDNTLEATDGDGYAQWFEKVNAETGGQLTYVVRLIKYLRDVKTTFSAKSVVLTTILGNQVEGTQQSDYTDVPTSMGILISRLDQWLQERPTMPSVTNPVLPTESFNRHWDQNKYSNFRDKINDLAKKVSDALSEQDNELCMEKWQDIFGSEFPSTDSVKAPDAKDAFAVPITDFPLGNSSHCQEPPWLEHIQYKAHLDAYLYSGNGLKRFRGINTGTKISSGLSIKFVCSTNAAPPYEIRWQVVNTGRHATEKHGLRGEFFRAKDLRNRLMTDEHMNWEASEFTGKHWIECFVIKEGQLLVARSGRFFVNIRNPNYP